MAYRAYRDGIGVHMSDRHLMGIRVGLVERHWTLFIVGLGVEASCLRIEGWMSYRSRIIFGFTIGNSTVAYIIFRILFNLVRPHLIRSRHRRHGKQFNSGYRFVWEKPSHQNGGLRFQRFGSQGFVTCTLENSVNKCECYYFDF